PRPEIRMTTRFLVMLQADFAPVDDARLAARQNAADGGHVFASLRQNRRYLCGLSCCDHHDHPDAAVERAHHLVCCDATGFREPGKDRRHVYRVKIELGGEVLGQHPWDVLWKTAAGDVSQRLDAVRRADR